MADMFKTMAAILLAATAMAPALAQDNHSDRSGEHHGGDHGGGDHRGGGHAQPAPAARPGGAPHGAAGFQPGPRGPEQGYRPGGPGGHPDFNHGPQPGMIHGGRGEMPAPGGAGFRPDDRAGENQGGHWQGRDSRGVDVWRGGAGGPAQGWERRGAPDEHRGDYERGPGWRGGADARAGWSRGWRQDDRYDWRGWRESHGDLYRLPRYRAPRGWGYRSFGIGVRIAPVFFAEQYWIADPWYYRLPPAYGPYRWVRYYNDALLVDVRTGMIADEIPGFFY